MCWAVGAGAQDSKAQEYGATATLRRPHDNLSARVEADEIALVPVRSAEDALRLVPGLTLVQHGSEGKGSQYFLRGFDAMHGADLEVTLEGIPLNEWSNVHAQGYLDLSFIPAELIQSVEVVKGPFELEQGAFAVAGSAALRLGVSTSELGTRASYTLGSTLRQRLMLSHAPRSSDGSQFVAAEIVEDPSYGQARQTSRASAMARAHLVDDARRGRLSLMAAGYAADFGLPGTVRSRDVAAGRLGFYDAYASQGQGESQRGLVALSYALTRGRHTVHVVSYTGYRRLVLFENFTGDLLDPEHGDFRLQRQRAWSFGTHGHYYARLGRWGGFRFGSGVRGDQLRQREDRTDPARMHVEARRGLTGPQLLTHALLGIELRAARLLRIHTGVRADWLYVGVRDEVAERAEQSGHRVAFSPRVRAVLSMTRELTLHASYGRGLRPPEARAFTRFRPEAQGIGEDQAPESRPSFTQSHSVELGVRMGKERVVSGDLTGFATYLARESVFDHVSGLTLALNGTRRLGGELVLRVSPASWLRLLGDLTAVDARFVESGNRVPFAPWLTAGARALFAHPSGVRAGLRFLAVAPRPLPYGARGEPLYVLDAVAGYAWGAVRCDLALENLLFRELREGEQYFASHWYRDEPRSQLPALQYVAGPPFNARLTVAVVFP